MVLLRLVVVVVDDNVVGSSSSLPPQSNLNYIESDGVLLVWYRQWPQFPHMPTDARWWGHHSRTSICIEAGLTRLTENARAWGEEGQVAGAWEGHAISKLVG